MVLCVAYVDDDLRIVYVTCLARLALCARRRQRCSYRDVGPAGLSVACRVSIDDLDVIDARLQILQDIVVRRCRGIYLRYGLLRRLACRPVRQAERVLVSLACLRACLLTVCRQICLVPRLELIFQTSIDPQRESTITGLVSLNSCSATTSGMRRIYLAKYIVDRLYCQLAGLRYDDVFTVVTSLAVGYDDGVVSCRHTSEGVQVVLYHAALRVLCRIRYSCYLHLYLIRLLASMRTYRNRAERLARATVDVGMRKVCLRSKALHLILRRRYTRVRIAYHTTWIVDRHGHLIEARRSCHLVRLRRRAACIRWQIIKRACRCCLILPLILIAIRVVCRHLSIKTVGVA